MFYMFLDNVSLSYTRGQVEYFYIILVIFLKNIIGCACLFSMTEVSVYAVAFFGLDFEIQRRDMVLSFFFFFSFSAELKS